MPMLRRGHGAVKKLRCKSGARFPPSTVVIVIVIVLVIVIVIILVIIIKLKRSNFFLMLVKFFLMLIKFLVDALSIFF